MIYFHQENFHFLYYAHKKYYKYYNFFSHMAKEHPNAQW